MLREAVSRLPNDEGLARGAAALVRKLLGDLRAGVAEPAALVEGACAGAVGGLILIDPNRVSEGGAAIVAVALETTQDFLAPADAVTASLRGVLRVAALAPEDVQWALKERIGQRFQDIEPIYDSIAASLQNK